MRPTIRDKWPCWVFDLYGTLVDILTDEEDPALWEQTARYLSLAGRPWTPAALRRAYRKACAEEERRLGDPLGEIDIVPVWARLAETDPAEAERIALLFRALSIRRLRCFAHAKELTAALRRKGRTVILLSNAQAAFTRPELRLLGLEDCFDAVFLSSECGVGKPSPAFFRKVTDLGFAPRDCVMVGNDDVCDCRGAAEAGMDSMYLRTEQSPRPAGKLPDNCVRVRGLREILAAAEGNEREEGL